MSLPVALLDLMNRRPGQRLTVAEFMDWALYDPEYGYYSRALERSQGPGVDFLTSPHISRDFGGLLAEQVAQCWRQMGSPARWQVVEMGPGQGLLAADLLAALAANHPACLAATELWLLERSASLRRTQRDRLADWGDRCRWLTWAEFEQADIEGVCFSNELVDAFPVHRLQWQADQWQELYLSVGEDGRLGEQPGPLSDPTLLSLLGQLGVDTAGLPEGYRTEVNLVARDWLASVARGLRRGYLLTIDYGYDVARYYSPARTDGTLTAYRQHRFGDDLWSHPGEQDLTAHVCFTALEQWGQALGLETLGFTRQALWLMALGLGDRLAGISASMVDAASLQAGLQRRDALQQLIDPLGLGGFGVLIQGRGLTAEERQLPVLDLLATVPAA